MEDTLLSLGLALFLLGLLTGTAVPMMRNPRMGLASHLQGMTNGPFLMVVGLMWPRVHLPHVWDVTSASLLIYGTYANWLATQLGALWGAGHRFAPGAAGDHRSSPGREQLVDGLLITVVPAMIISTVILIVGISR